MESKTDQIREVLENLFKSHEKIYGCMVCQKGLTGVIVFPADFTDTIQDKWEPIKATMDDVLRMVERRSEFGLDRVYIELLGLDILFFVLLASDNALIIFTPAKTRSLTGDTIHVIEASAEKARDDIIRIIES